MGSVYEVELSHGQQAVLLAMADHAQDDGSDVFPSKARLAWKTGYDERQVQRIIKQLREQGVLVEVAPPAQHRPTEYRINLGAAKPKPAFVANVPSESRGDISNTRGDISNTPGETPRPPKPSKEPSEEPSTPTPSQPTVKSQTTKDIENVWATYVEVMNPRGRGKELDAESRKLIRDGLKVADAAELSLAIKTCGLSDFHMKRGKHKNRPGGKYNALAQIIKARRGRNETTRSRIEWWLDRADEIEAGEEVKFDVNDEFERVRREQGLA